MIDCYTFILQDVTLLFSKIIQAVAVRTETEHFRRWQSDIGTYGEGKTMGALYWMFADVWPSASWSSIGTHLISILITFIWVLLISLQSKMLEYYIVNVGIHINTLFF